MNPRAFDLYLRSVTASLLALIIVSAAMWALVTGAPNADKLALVGLAGSIVGVYFGAHVAHNGQGGKRRAEDDVHDARPRRRVEEGINSAD